jgi:uncharacterized protein YbjT (DUF2867 family)
MTPSHAQPGRIVIVGGSGKVAKELIRLLRVRGDEAVALFRNQARYDELSELGAVPVVLDIEAASVDDLAAEFGGADAVVFSAGAGGGSAARTHAVDFEGAVAAMAAAEKAGVSMRPYYEAKHDADVALTESSLDWTIVRPGGLTDDPATGRVTIGEKVEPGSIPRADVAATILAALDDVRTVRRAWEVVGGEHTVAEAIDAAL